MGAVGEAALTGFVIEILGRAGFEPEPARRTAAVFIEADLRGVHSHGLNGLPGRLHQIEKGLLNPNARPTPVTAAGATVLLDGHQGFGPVLCSDAAERAVVLAQQFGIGLVALRDSSHWVCPAYYTRWMALHGTIGIALTNTNPGMPLHGSREKSVTNAPFSVAAPISGQEPVVLDMSFQQMSWGGMRLVAEAGERLPGPWGYDEQGRETDDPQAIIDSGRVRPIGDHKGSGFAFMQEILTGIVGAGLISAQIGQMTAAGEPAHYSQSFIAIKAGLFEAPSDFDRRMQALCDSARAAAPAEGVEAVRLPGDGSRARLAERRRNGIPYGAIRRPLEHLSARYGVPLPALSRTAA